MPVLELFIGYITFIIMCAPSQIITLVQWLLKNGEENNYGKEPNIHKAKKLVREKSLNLFKFITVHHEHLESSEVTNH